jgi:hypothetical protein
MLVYAFYPLVETNGNEELKTNNALIIAVSFMGRINKDLGWLQPNIAVLTNLCSHSRFKQENTPGSTNNTMIL